MIRIQSTLQSLFYTLLRILLAFSLYLIIKNHMETGQFFEPIYLLIELLLISIILYSDGDRIMVDKENFVYQEGKLFNSKMSIPLQEIKNFRLKGKIDHPLQAFLALPPFRFLGYQSHLQFTMHSGKTINIHTSMPGSELKDLNRLIGSKY